MYLCFIDLLFFMYLWKMFLYIMLFVVLSFFLDGWWLFMNGLLMVILNVRWEIWDLMEKGLWLKMMVFFNIVSLVLVGVISLMCGNFLCSVFCIMGDFVNLFIKRNVFVFFIFGIINICCKCLISLFKGFLKNFFINLELIFNLLDIVLIFW